MFINTLIVITVLSCSDLISAGADHDLIVAGTDANPGEFPWQIALQQYIQGDWYFICGGSLITNRAVLTAKHCMNPSASPSEYRIVLGEIDRRKFVEATKHFVQLFALPDPINSNTVNDLAVLLLSKPVQPNDFIRPIQLTTGTQLPDPGTNFVITGWGKTKCNGDDNPNVLQKIMQPVLNNSLQICKKTGAGGDKFCAGNTTGPYSGAFSGDSGGPAVVNVNGQLQQIGLVHGGDVPCHDGSVTTYTSVAVHIEWIKQFLREMEDDSDCGVARNDRVDCGYLGIEADQCTSNPKCCWDSSVGNGLPWCFYKNDMQPDNPICAIQTSSRQNCGYLGITEDDCVVQNGCCYDADVSDGVPWCYYRNE